MKKTIHIKNTFKTPPDAELLRKAVTAKVEKLINEKIRKPV